MNQTKDDSPLIAFFGVRPTSDKIGYIGAILVLDMAGVPREFHCTHPIKPSAVQRALYGGGLETHVLVDLCGAPLVQALTTQPVACLVETRDALQLRDKASIPIYHAQQTDNILETDEAKENDGEVLSLIGPRWSGAKKYSLFGPATPIGQSPDIQGLLQEVCKRVDPLEPFERITTAIETLASRDDRFR